ncbi:MAG: hypothetical protein PHR71_05645, partial [Polaromonas sp.]|nr:hypothetical protein [Polaromonas sp.]
EKLARRSVPVMAVDGALEAEAVGTVTGKSRQRRVKSVRWRRPDCLLSGIIVHYEAGFSAFLPLGRPAGATPMGSGDILVVDDLHDRVIVIDHLAMAK